MILAIAKNRLWNLRRDRAAMVLSFVVPLVFFSVFAAIFGRGSGRSATNPVKFVVVDEDRSESSIRFVAALQAETALKVTTSSPPKSGATGASAPYTAATAEAAVRGGDFPVAVVLPKGFGDRPIRFGSGLSGERSKILLLSDPSDPVAPQVLAGLLQKVAMTAMPEAMARAGIEEVEKWSGGLTAEQKGRLEEGVAGIRRQTNPVAGATPAAAPARSDLGSGLVDVVSRDVVGEKKSNPLIAFYAAGIGVMFLLFSAAGAGGALIEEAETGTLDRILSTRVTMTRLLAGKLTYLAGLAATQLLVMFLWGALVFGLEMRRHWAGFLIMTAATSLAASTFGLLLAALSRSRMQLVALSNLTVLVMSALGGSMFPRFLMPEIMQKVGLITLNAWAIDGFQKVFWREEPIQNLAPQVLVLCGIALAFFLLARRVARRWEPI
ncbi:MAG: ABC transporter permease [Acidobacteriota bacterium]|nr:ABC transporter permease [Acidobacteriota bacterium]